MRFLEGTLIGYFALSKGGIAIVCDLDNWPESSYRPHGMKAQPLYVRLAAEREIDEHLKEK